MEKSKSENINMQNTPLRITYTEPVISEADYTGNTEDVLVRSADEDVRALYLPAPAQRPGVISRALTEGLFGENVATPAEADRLKRSISKAVKSGRLAEDVLITIDGNTGKRYNNLTVLDKKVIIALQVCLSDQTEGGNEIIQANRPTEVRKAKRKGTSTELVAPDFQGYNILALPTSFQEALKGAGFNESDIVIIFERSEFLRKYLGAGVGGNNYERLQKTIAKLKRGRAAIIGSDKHKGAAATTISIISDYLTHSCNGTILYVVKLNPLFGKDIARNYRRTPTNNAAILNAIGDNDSLFRMYDYILTQLSYNAPNAKIEVRGSSRVITENEEKLLKDFFTPNTIRKGRNAALEKMYKGFDVFHKLGLLRNKVERKANGTIELVLDREAFGRPAEAAE